MHPRKLVLVALVSGLSALCGCDNNPSTEADAGTSMDSGPSGADTGPMMDRDASAADGGSARDGGSKPSDGGTMSDGGMAKPDGGAMTGDGGMIAADARPALDGSGVCGATDLASAMGESVATGSTVGATASYARSCAGSTPGGNRAFLWTAPSAGDYLFDTNGSTYDTALMLYSACVGGTELACDDDGGVGAESRIARTMAMGETVVVVVDGYDGSEGDFVLSIHAGTDTELMCFDGIDEDRDGETDCLDFDCASDPGCTETDCTNGIDDDMDGDADCADFDCDAEPSCHETDCGNGLDDDMDGATDCRDFDCAGDPRCTETECTNGMDDDMDGATDCADFDCDTDPACVETDCADGVDDERDGLIDCDDFDCFGDAACGESMCTDSMDDDMDGRVDCADSECTCDAACLTPSCPDMDLGMMTGSPVITGTMAPGCSEFTGSCAGGGPEIMYRWVAPSAGTFTVTTLGSTFDTVLYVLRGGCGGVEAACNDDEDVTFTLQSSVTFTATMGEVFVIALDSYGSRVGDFALNITTP